MTTTTVLTPAPAPIPTMTEEELIRSRLLLFESRPFSRINKRIASLAPPAPTSKPTPTAAAAPAALPLPSHAEIDLDFSHFTGVLTRLQLLLSTNTREVTRYSSKATTIATLCEKARTDLISLRDELAAAQVEKANRLVYDEIARDILATRALKPRDEQHENIARLEAEIEELERERGEYEATWVARRVQFAAIVGQLEMLWASIKEEKEEQERREGMSEEPEGEAEGE
ncbi:hypothetical protein EDC01DRAFT_699061, partial [Geopyxis carbonaria]